jgi:prolipoprotein diacylglyceryltransferase
VHVTLSYRTCVLGGCATGIAVATLFATRAGLTPLLWLAVAAFAVSVALFLAAMTKVLFGVESFSFLHYQLATVAATLLVFAPALDLLALALTIAQAIGRLGCASAGCCHGRVGRFRVQYVESAALFAIAAVMVGAYGTYGTYGSYSSYSSHSSQFLFYVLAYAATRFVLELYRTDERRHWRGVSEAQWICVLTSIAAAAWQQGLAIVVAVALVVAAIARMTSRMRVSHGVTGGVEHYTISGVTPRRARTLARRANAQLVPGTTPGVYHLLLGDSR